MSRVIFWQYFLKISYSISLQTQKGDYYFRQKAFPNNLIL
ncbi:hypothetical protein D1BOALGB6SA_9223 [Olavius sp. associated proteobacterium Delta 1]|nr:hypothetical protein D1BOALGB6SA_9223 [Olavius sp. associated proteobacterium Delta 1]